MKILLFVLLLTSTIFAQDFAKDTLMVNGTQPATILKIKNHKIIIAQNKDLVKPYIKQKDGKLISNGVPFIQIHLDKNKHTIGNTYDYIDILFDILKPTDYGSNSIIDIDNTRVFLQDNRYPKLKKQQLYIIYPLNDRFINLSFVFTYENDIDREKKEKGVMDLITHGLIILENYYLEFKK